MSRDADTITWSRARPRVEARIADLTEQLVLAPIDQVVALQAEIKALKGVASIFEGIARDLRNPVEPDETPTY